MLKNAKHEHFAQMVVKGMSVPHAYITAGYSDAYGHVQSANKLLKKSDVAARIADLKRLVEEPTRERAIEKAALDKAWVLHQLMENVSMAKAAEPVKDSEGNPTGEYRQNLAAANKALELLGKELGMFVDRSEVRTGPLDTMEHDELKVIDATIAAIQRARGSIPASVGRIGA